MKTFHRTLQNSFWTIYVDSPNLTTTLQAQSESLSWPAIIQHTLQIWRQRRIRRVTRSQTGLLFSLNSGTEWIILLANVMVIPLEKTSQQPDVPNLGKLLYDGEDNLVVRGYPIPKVLSSIPSGHGLPVVFLEKDALSFTCSSMRCVWIHCNNVTMATKAQATPQSITFNPGIFTWYSYYDLVKVKNIKISLYLSLKSALHNFWVPCRHYLTFTRVR